jgi:hypothetical protein
MLLLLLLLLLLQLLMLIIIIIIIIIISSCLSRIFQVHTRILSAFVSRCPSSVYGIEWISGGISYETHHRDDVRFFFEFQKGIPQIQLN